MKLIDLLDNINKFDDDSVIFVPINSRLDKNIEVLVSRIIIIDV